MIKSVALVFGTRPEAIKMAPLIHYFNDLPDRFRVSVCVSAQHRQMLDQVLELFDIVPNVDLDLMKSGQDLFDVTTDVLISMREFLRSESPDILLVHGDTTTCMAASMAAFYLNIPVGHVEAGLRTYKIREPFPEEFNRQIVGKIATYHFTPTQSGKANLEEEGVKSCNIKVTGNTVIDSLRWVLSRIDSDPSRASALTLEIQSLLEFNFIEENYILITGHRRENFGEGLLQICKSLKELAGLHPSFRFVYPVHLNPNVREPVFKMLGGIQNIVLVAPQQYEQFIWLLKHSYLVLTDSGGIQEEAPSLGKPVLVLRDVTERPEAVEAGTVKLVGSRKETIIPAVSSLIENPDLYSEMSTAHNPYGTGNACKLIAEFLSTELN